MFRKRGLLMNIATVRAQEKILTWKDFASEYADEMLIFGLAFAVVVALFEGASLNVWLSATFAITVFPLLGVLIGRWKYRSLVKEAEREVDA